MALTDKHFSSDKFLKNIDKKYDDPWRSLARKYPNEIYWLVTGNNVPANEITVADPHVLEFKKIPDSRFELALNDKEFIYHTEIESGKTDMGIRLLDYNRLYALQEKFRYEKEYALAEDKASVQKPRPIISSLIRVKPHGKKVNTKEAYETYTEKHGELFLLDNSLKAKSVSPVACDGTRSAGITPFLPSGRRRPG